MDTISKLAQSKIPLEALKMRINLYKLEHFFGFQSDHARLEFARRMLLEYKDSVELS